MTSLDSNTTVSRQPPQKYDGLSKVDADFAPLQAAVDGHLKPLFKLPISQLRAAILAAPQVFPEGTPMPGDHFSLSHERVQVRDGAMVEVRIYKPTGACNNAPLVLVAHGGGWCTGSHDVDEAQNRWVVTKNRAVVVSVDYRLAPEYSFPYALDDCFDVLVWAKSRASTLAIDPENIILTGSSAGGNLAASLALLARERQVSGIKGQVLNVPVTCHPEFFPSEKYEYGSWLQNKDASILDARTMRWFWDQYLPSPTPEVYSSPLLGDLKSLPPALIQIAGLDPLRDEGFAYAEKLKEAGVKVEVEVYPGLPHGFHTLPQLAASTRYLESVVNFIRQTVQTF